MGKKRILSILDSVDFYGKEKANILVYSVVARLGCDLLILFNEKASMQLKDALYKYPHQSIPFPRCIVGGWKIFRYPLLFISSNWKVYRIIRAYKPDFILLPTEVALSYLFLPLLITRKRLVFRMGDDPIVLRFSGCFSKLYSWFWRSLIVNRLHAVVCITNYIQENLIRSGFKRKDRLRVIYNYPPVASRGVGAEINLDKRSDELKFGFIGRIVPEKGLLLLVESIANLKKQGVNCLLFVAGVTTLDPDYSTKIFQVIRDNHLEHSIIFLGRVENVEFFFRKIDVLCVPSIYPEPSGNVIVEGKWFGRPAIVFDKGGMPELVDHLQDGYICKEANVNGLKEALLYYISSSDAVFQQGRMAKKSLEQKGITFSSFCSQWQSVFEE